MQTPGPVLQQETSIQMAERNMESISAMYESRTRPSIPMEDPSEALT